VVKFVEARRAKGLQVTWYQIKKHGDQKLKININLSTLRKYGRKLGITQRHTREATKYTETSEFKGNVQEFRKLASWLPKAGLVFIDETPVKGTLIPAGTLGLAGDTGQISVDCAKSFAPRIDVIAAITATQKFPLYFITPKDHKRQGTKGVGVAWFNEALAAWILALEDSPRPSSRSHWTCQRRTVQSACGRC